MFSRAVVVYLVVIPLLLASSFACSRGAFRGIFGGGGRVISRSSSRASMETARQQLSQHVVTTAGQEVVKKSLAEQAKELAKDGMKKGAEFAAQGVLFGAVDAAGDAIRGDSNTNSDKALLKISENQIKIETKKAELEERRMQHEEKMKNMELEKVKGQLAYTPRVIIEEVDSKEESGPVSISGTRGSPSTKVTSSSAFNLSHQVNTNDQKELPKWAQYILYCCGACAGFLAVVLAQQCLQGVLGSANSGSRRQQRQNAPGPLPLSLALIAIIIVIGVVVAVSAEQENTEYARKVQRAQEFVKAVDQMLVKSGPAGHSDPIFDSPIFWNILAVALELPFAFEQLVIPRVEE